MVQLRFLVNKFVTRMMWEEGACLNLLDPAKRNLNIKRATAPRCASRSCCAANINDALRGVAALLIFTVRFAGLELFEACTHYLAQHLC